MSAGRRLGRLLGLGLGAAHLVLASAGRAQEVDPERASRIRAGMVLNFLRFAEWPEEAFPDAASPVVVHVLGDPDLAAILVDLVRGEKLGAYGREIVVREIAPPGGQAEQTREIGASHLLFVGRSGTGAARGVLERLAGRPVLTVGDPPGFAESGGMIGLVVRDGRMAFEANPGAISRSGVRLSSKVLRLARIVETAGP
jgi:hypothetical protein